MSKFFRPWMVIVLSISGYLTSAHAQMQMWGSGMYPAMPACQYEAKTADDASDLKDELKEREKELKDAQYDLSRVKSKLSSVSSQVSTQRDLFKQFGFEGSAFNFIERHINSGGSCRDYKGYCKAHPGVSQVEKYPYWYFAYMMNEHLRGNPEATIDGYWDAGSLQSVAVQSEEVKTTVAVNSSRSQPSRMPAADMNAGKKDEETVDETAPDKPTEGADLPTPPPKKKGQDRVPLPAPAPVEEPTPVVRQPRPQPPVREVPVETPQCNDRGLPIEGGFIDQAWHDNCGPGRGEVRSGICRHTSGVDSVPRSYNSSSCEKYLAGWQEKKKEEDDLKAEKLRLEATVKELKALVKSSKRDYDDAKKEIERERRELATEGGCLDCLIQGGTTYQPRKPTIWETVGNFALAGLSIYGGMQNSRYIADQNAKLGFQSSPMPLMGAVANYGYPFIMAGLQGVLPGGMGQGGIGCAGSAFNGGGAMGMNGMAGPMGMMNPYGMNGFSPGSMWGMPNSMYGSPFGNGMFNAGMGLGFNPGFGASNYCPVWPCPMGMNGMGGLGGMGGMGMNPFGMGMGMNPFGMGGMGGMGMNPFAMGMNPMMPGILSPGISGGIGMGMNPFGMGGMGMNPLMNGAGMGGLGGLGGNSMANYQMMQMQQQMAMQQYNMQMQMQMRNYQNQMARQQALAGLYSEMNNLMMRIQMTQTQMSSGGMLGFDNSFMPQSSYSPMTTTLPGYGTTTPFYNVNPGYSTPTSGLPSYR